MSDQTPAAGLNATSREFASGQKIFGRYTLVKILGRGGMGIVWLAHDEELERDVALKFLPDLIIHDAAVLSDLKRETRRCLELTHKNIVRIYDFVHDERSACISMEYIDGETLSNLRAEKEQKVFEPNEIAAWTSQLCDALDYAHNHAKIIHRDLKPANLMVNQRGDLKVSDFGIARSLGDSMSKLTMEQGRSGTLLYMSPQQLGGERGSHLDDIYSLGASLYELLTTKPPFYSGNVDRQIREKVPPSMTARRKEFEIEAGPIPPEWEEMVAGCLAKDPEKRPQTTSEIARRLQAGGPTPTHKTAEISLKPSKKILVPVAVAALCLIAFGAWYFGIFKTRERRQAQSASAPSNSIESTRNASGPVVSDKSIAVLPFENLSDDKQNAFFTDGVQDEILANLAKVADLKVISRTSVMLYKSGNPRNLREIGQQLGVAHVLEGSVQRAASRVRVTAQLIDARTDAHLWAQTYDRDLADVFAIQSDIAKAIADQLQAKLSPNEKSSIEERPTKDITAYDLYLRAKALAATRVVFNARAKDNLMEASRLLDQAITRDPDFFLAYCLLATTHGNLYFYGYDHTAERRALAQRAVETALRLRPEAGEAHSARAGYLYRCYLDYDHARSELALAQRTLPNSAEVLALMGYIDRRQSRWDESTRNLEKALQVDPRNQFILQQVAGSYQVLRRYADMAAALDRALKLAPSDVGLRVQRTLVALEWRADPKPLHETIETIVAENPAAASDIADRWLNLALCERDPAGLARAVAHIPANGIGINLPNFPLSWCQGLVARSLGEEAAAQKAFSLARADVERTVREQPDYGAAFCLLGLIDAGLGRKEEAISEGRRAVELLPVTKDSIDGANMMKYLAVIYAWTGEKDLAVQQIAATLQVPADLSYGQLKLHPYWDPLRGDPRFEKIVAKLAPSP